MQKRMCHPNILFTLKINVTQEFCSKSFSEILHLTLSVKAGVRNEKNEKSSKILYNNTFNKIGNTMN